MTRPGALAILHFHLNPGGVTQVVRNHVAAWNDAWREHCPLPVALFHGGRTTAVQPDAFADLSNLAVRMRAIPELEYDELRSDEDLSPEELAAAIEAALAEFGFRSDETLLHWHNHSLGKNVAAPGAIAALAQRGWRQLLQIHDFAEDARPENFARLRQADAWRDVPKPLYPLASTIRYATLTGRDRHLLIGAGLPPDAVSVLPNPVHASPILPDREAARRRVVEALNFSGVRRWGLYPVRGIRRKNLGELLLWAAMSPRDVAYGITLRPETPVEERSYAAWKRAAEEFSLNVVFDVGDRPQLDFATNVAAADALFTTSVAEGFGMVFLEAPLAGKPLLGRDLPEITADFREKGIEYPGLVSSIEIPLEWIGDGGLAELRTAYLEQAATYRLADAAIGFWERHEATLAARGTIDFGASLPRQQRVIVETIARSWEMRDDLDAVNPAWSKIRRDWERGDGEPLAADSRSERDGLAAFSIERLGRELLALAERCLEAPAAIDVVEGADSTALAKEFLSPERFRPVRFVPFDDE